MLTAAAAAAAVFAAAFNLDYCTEVQDLGYLVHSIGGAHCPNNLYSVLHQVLFLSSSPSSAAAAVALAAFNLDYYTEVQDLGYLVHSMGGGPFSKRYRKLSAGLCDVVQDFGLVAFTPLAVQVRLVFLGSSMSSSDSDVN